VYAKQAISVLVEFGTKKKNHYKPTYALNVL